VRREIGEEQRVKVSDNEGIANQTGPPGRPTMRKLQAKELKTSRALLKTTEVSVQEVAMRFDVSRSTLYRNKLT
jgi:DNA-binding NtrC family response regulator